MKKPLILLVDDDRAVLNALAEWLSFSGYPVLTAENPFLALNLLYNQDVKILITDLNMPEMNGIDLMKRAKKLIPSLFVFLISAHGTIPEAITALKEGAFDFLEKPFCPKRLELGLAKIIEQQKILEENIKLKQELKQEISLGDMVGKSRQIREVFQLIGKVAKTNAQILLEGESGTGKELAARALHQHSLRRNKPFIPISCASIPDTLMESELFGYEKGAYTGASERKAGCFESANGGTIFLDEIGEMKPVTQVHLLRVLQEKEVRRIGGRELIKLDVRIISATNKDLKVEVEKGNFREDLYYRLNVIKINLPPLRERPEDIILLAHFFLEKFSTESQREIEGFSPQAKAIFLNYSWPGNIRQLENAIWHAVIVAKDCYIDVSDLPLELIATVSKSDHSCIQEQSFSLKQVEQKMILAALESTGGNRSRAAKLLGISRPTFYEKFKQFQGCVK